MGISNEASHELLLKKSKVILCYFSKQPFNQLYITNKTGRFSCKCGRDIRVTRLIKEDWPIVNFGLKPLYNSITKVLQYKDERIKFVCVAICTLVMSLHSHDLLLI